MSEKIPFDKLVDYVRDRLPQDQLIEIGQAIQKDPNLTKTVEGIREYLKSHSEDEMKEMHERLDSRLDNILESHKPKQSRNKLIIYMVIIGVIVTVLLLLIL